MTLQIKSRTKIALASLLTATALVVLPAVAFAGFAPANRPTFQCITPTNCPGANYVTFNSFTNASNYGDERAFFDGKDASITGPGGYQDSIAVHNGEELVLRVYIHNNANPNAIGVDAATAHNTNMQVQLPSNQKASNVAAADIAASNANPTSISDTVNFTGASPFTLAFDQSAPVQITYRPNGAGDFVTRPLHSASFAGPNVLNANFGDWNGCFNFAALVTFQVKVSMPTPLTPPKPPVTPPKTPPTTPTTPPTTPATPAAPTTLVNTGPGSDAAIFAIVTVAGTIGYRLYLGRRLSRQ